MTEPVRYGLTPQQLACFSKIQTFISTNRQAPSRREIAKMMGWKSIGRAQEVIAALQERGWIRLLPAKARSIAIVTEAAGYTLPPGVEAALQDHCRSTGDDPAAVVADAVALMLDEAEGSIAA